MVGLSYRKSFSDISNQHCRSAGWMFDDGLAISIQRSPIRRDTDWLKGFTHWCRRPNSFQERRTTFQNDTKEFYPRASCGRMQSMAQPWAGVTVAMVEHRFTKEFAILFERLG